MSKRQKTTATVASAPEVEAMEQEEAPEAPPETRRTRSGRKVRTPAALLDSAAPVRTPTRRSRRTALQELPLEEENNAEVAEVRPESLPEEKLEMPAESEPCVPAEPQAEAAAVVGDAPSAGVNGSGDGHVTAAEPTETEPTPTENIPKKKKKRSNSESSVKQTQTIPLGKPKSGRVWKDRNKQRFSALLRDKPLCTSWQKKMAAKQEKNLMKQYSLQLKEEKAKQKEEKRLRREENLKRRAENERRAEIVQVIKNTTKIKRMKKKQLRKIEKRDTLALMQKQEQKQKVNAKGQKSNKIVKDLT